jgi:hypothetical protein
LRKSAGFSGGGKRIGKILGTKKADGSRLLLILSLSGFRFTGAQGRAGNFIIRPTKASRKYTK